MALEAAAGSPPELELKLKLSPPRDHRLAVSPKGFVSLTEISPRSSCMSRELSPDGGMRHSCSPEASIMMVMGCPQCLMYVMLLFEGEGSPRCPKCKSAVLLDFLHEDRVNWLKK